MEMVLMVIQQKLMGSAGGTKAMGCNNGGYDGDGTSRIASELKRNNNNRVEIVAKHQEACLSCSEHGNDNGDKKDGAMVGVGLMDRNNTGDGGGGVGSTMNMRMRG